MVLPVAHDVSNYRRSRGERFCGGLSLAVVVPLLLYIVNDVGGVEAGLHFILMASNADACVVIVRRC